MTGLSKLSGLCAIAAFAAVLPVARAGTFSTDFNSGLPTNSAVFGSATVADNVVKLTTTDPTVQQGTFIITNDIDAGTAVASFTASFKVRIGGSSARWEFGNGMSFCFAPDLPLDDWGLNGDSGVGSGLKVAFHTPKDNAAIPAPTIAVPAAGANSPVFVDALRANTLVDCVIQYNPDSTLTIVYDGVRVYENVPVSYTPVAGSIFGIGARTGSWVDNHFIDDLNIATRTNAMPYIRTFAPAGRKVQPGKSIDITITNYSTALDPSTVVLTLDGVTRTPTITPDGLGNTTIHYAPSSAFAPSSQHTVSLTFADNSVPAQTETFSWGFTAGEALPTNFVTVFKEGFETYARGYLDKNLVSDPNYGPNGSGNPWFGPYPENYSVVDSASPNGVAATPHSGTNMMNWAFNGPSIWIDLAYRFHSGQPIKGNAKLDWWFFDANDQVNGFKDYVSLYYYNVTDVPATADWPAKYNGLEANGFYWDDINWSGLTAYQSLSLGGSRYTQTGGNYDLTKYQIRLEEMCCGGSYGIDGWVNTVPRTQGWHHASILMGPPHADGTVMVYFYIDDMVNPVYSGLSTIAAQGVSILEIDSGGSTATKACYDDLTLALVRPPPLVAAPAAGKHLTLTWPGEGFTLQSGPSVNGPWTDIAGASSGYQYDTTTANPQFFRLRN